MRGEDRKKRRAGEMGGGSPPPPFQIPGSATGSRPMLAASRGGGKKSNSGLSGLFKIFLKIFYLARCACKDEKLVLSRMLLAVPARYRKGPLSQKSAIAKVPG